ncbi:UDP-glucuronosyltransferase 2B33-like [Anoplophora glabripennis]|uniref:UDP-glucuronosyltransferase 2B33-like n=1 Tax=Anoplophora glabripennis TaxID=217634 RepID=UPI0008749309|nr:UDP-glucuronosyltransferase 2B33-like [Anoplophora glabripennis]
MRNVFSSLLIIGVFVTLSHGARILVVSALGSHSHFILGFRLAKELADRGHQVTFINSFPQKEPIKNLRDISVEEVRHVLTQKRKSIYEISKWTYLSQISFTAHVGNSYTEKVLQVKEVQELLHSDEHFDLVLINNFFYEPMAIFQYKFKCPMIILAPGPTTIFSNHLFANPSQPAYVPNLLTSFGSEMTLWERIINVYYDTAGELFVHFVNIPRQNEILQRIVPGAPNLRDILYNASFMLLVSHVSLRDPSPLQPNVKEIGGYHLLPPKPLPKDLQQFLDNATEGVLFFSMGSVLKSTDCPEEKLKIIIKVFSKLKQKVLWKYEDDLPEKPENVKIVSWLPQQDVLGHPNVIAFISHGGLLGKIEAVYHGVPMLGLPVFWDQMKNCRESFRHGIALTIPFRQLTEENFYRALNELINNPKYRDNAKMRSRIMRDQPLKQIDEAMFWIEYVIRHKGAPHYRSPALNLKWYQRLLLDVILAVGVAAALVLAIIFCTLRTIIRSINRRVLRKIKVGQKLD